MLRLGPDLPCQFAICRGGKMNNETEAKVPGQKRPDWEQIAMELSDLLEPKEKEKEA